MSIRDEIINILRIQPGLKARDIAKRLGVKKNIVNSTLYSTLDGRVTQDSSYGWHSNQTEDENTESHLSRNPSLVSESDTLDEESLPDIISLKLEDDYDQEAAKEIEGFNELETGNADVHLRLSASDTSQNNLVSSQQTDTDKQKLETNPYKNYMIPYPSFKEERKLWSHYIKWRHVKNILDSEDTPEDISQAMYFLIIKLVQSICKAENLITIIRNHLQLDSLGDVLIENPGKRDITIELYRRMLYSRANVDSGANTGIQTDCCLKDLFGYIFSETLNNAAFGRGNANLFNKIMQKINTPKSVIKDRLYTLAIERELLPISILELVAPETPISKLAYAIKDLESVQNPRNTINNYRIFIENIKTEAEKALDTIVRSHLQLALRSVSEFLNKELSLPYDDLIQEASVGLLRAAENFKPTYGYRFMSFAPRVIYQSIERAILDKTRIIRIPIHAIKKIDQVIECSQRLILRYGREATYKEIATEIGMPISKVREMIIFSQPVISLNSLNSSHEDRCKDLLADGEYEDEDNILEKDTIDQGLLPLVETTFQNQLKDIIHEKLGTLTPREQRVIELRFGLEDGRERTLEEVGSEFRVTRERIRQIQEKALGKLRHPSRSRALKEYLK